jgi:hypothetical protein
MKFDCIVTNPPYSDASHTERKNTLWRKWFQFDTLLNSNGVFAEIIPASWMGSPPLMNEYFLDNNKQLKVDLWFINRDECKKHFPNIGSNFSYLIYSKQPYRGQTDLVVKNINGTIDTFTTNLNDCIFEVFPRDLHPLGISILNKTLTQPPLGILNTTVCHANNKHLWRTTPVDTFVYPIEKTPNSTIYYNKPHPHQDILKVVIPTTTYYRAMYVTTHGTSQSFCYYNIPTGCDSTVVVHNLKNKLFQYLNECFRYSNWNSVNLLRKLPSIPMEKELTDTDVYTLFHLTPDEIQHIEDTITWI